MLKTQFASSLILAGYVLAWVLGSEMTQLITTDRENSFEKPAFLTFLNHLGLIIFFPVVSVCVRAEHGSLHNYLNHWSGTKTPTHLFFVYGAVSLVYNTCIYCWVTGLEFIDVSLSNGLYQLQTLFALVLSYIFLKEKFENQKLQGVAVAIIGVAFVCIPPIFLTDDSDSKNDDTSLSKGVMWTVLSAAMWGGYEVSFSSVIIYKKDETKKISESAGADGVVETLTCLGFVGLGTLFFGAPCLVLLDATGIETFTLPVGVQWSNVLVNFAISMLFDFFFGLALFKTSPVCVSLVSSLVIPVSFIADHIFHDKELEITPFFGSALVILGLWRMNGGVTQSAVDKPCDDNRDTDKLLVWT